tara:strand:+ start:3691 stop:4419 length:729 start_codon:yes stop_codon:yes gene_type:complete
MILTGHQSSYLPWIGLFHKIAISDTFCYMDNVQYQVNDYNNRNKIKGPNGGFWLTVPVYRKDHFDTKLKDALIVNNSSWAKKHWKSLVSCYSNAPYFGKYSEFFEHVYMQEWKYLSELNEHILVFLMKSLGLDVEYFRMSELELEGEKSDLILDMCIKTNARMFVFGAMGSNYVNVDEFDRQGIKVYFQDYTHPEYSQLFDGFESHLSVLDLLFNSGPSSLDILMTANVNYEQVELMIKDAN